MDTLSTLGLAASLIAGLFETHGAPPLRAAVVAPKVVEQAHRFEVDPFLVAAIISLENPWLIRDTLSRVGAIGLMQVMPFWTTSNFARTCGEDPTRDRTNICLGIQVLKFHVNRASTLRQALLDYSGCRSTPGCERYPDLVTQRRARLQREFFMGQAEIQVPPWLVPLDSTGRHDTLHGYFLLSPFFMGPGSLGRFHTESRRRCGAPLGARRSNDASPTSIRQPGRCRTYR